MGLIIHSLGELPIETKRGYYIYLLDYGWHEPLGDVLNDNFNLMSDLASRNNAVVIKGTGAHFENEVFSWHHINGEDSEELLPAILITMEHPAKFKEKSNYFYNTSFKIKDVKHNNIVLIPLKEVCTSSSDVVELIKKIFSDIKQKKSLKDFYIVKKIKKGDGKSIVDALILKPSFMGAGIDLKELASFLSKIGRK